MRLVWRGPGATSLAGLRRLSESETREALLVWARAPGSPALSLAHTCGHWAGGLGAVTTSCLCCQGQGSSELQAQLDRARGPPRSPRGHPARLLVRPALPPCAVPPASRVEMRLCWQARPAPTLPACPLPGPSRERAAGEPAMPCPRPPSQGPGGGPPAVSLRPPTPRPEREPALEPRAAACGPQMQQHQAWLVRAESSPPEPPLLQDTSHEPTWSLGGQSHPGWPFQCRPALLWRPGQIRGRRLSGRPLALPSPRRARGGLFLPTSHHSLPWALPDDPIHPHLSR